MATLFSLLASKLGQLAVVFLLGFVAGGWLMWKWCHHERSFSQSFTVADVSNGATLEVSSGLFGRRSKRVALEGIAAPGLDDPLGQEARESLRKLAGSVIRVETASRMALAQNIVGHCFGESGVDLAVAQVTAGLATCETSASVELKAAQRAAQKAKRGLWAKQTADGSHWWHFSSVNEDPHPEPQTLNPGTPMLPFDLGNMLQLAVLAIAVFWIAWSFVGKPIVARWQAAAAVTTVVDTSQQIAAYGALTAIRHVAVVEKDAKAVESCEYLRGVVTSWPSPKP